MCVEYAAYGPSQNNQVTRRAIRRAGSASSDVIMAPLSKVWPSTPEIDHFRPVGGTDNIDKKTLLGMVESKSG